MAQASPTPTGQSRPCPHCSDQHPRKFSHCPQTGQSLATGVALVGQVVADRYRVLGLLGEGGMGAVYFAEHTLIGRKVALKRLHPELATDANSVARFQREARAAAAIGHRHIVEVLDLGYGADGAPFLVMEYLRGQSLAELLRKEARLAPARACRIVGQVLTALAAVHDSKIVHRDLKPDNVFLVRRRADPDFVKVLDFGISKMNIDDDEGLRLTKTGVMLGTPYYMSPEQARGMKVVDRRVDIYAIGVILYEALCGELPHRAENYHALLLEILAKAPVPLAERAPGVSPELAEVVHRAIAKDPAKRFQSARSMQLALVPHGASPPDAPRLFASSTGPEGGQPITSQSGLRAAGRAAQTVRGVADTPMAGVSRPSGFSPAPHRFVATSSNWEDDGRSLLPKDTAPYASDASGYPAPAMSIRESSASFRALPEEQTAIPRQSARTGSPGSALRVKGALLLAALEHLQSVHGPGTRTKLIESLAPSERAPLTGMLTPIGYFPLSVYDAVIAAAERMFGTGDGRLAVSLGQTAAVRDLPTLHRHLIRDATPRDVLLRIPEIYGAYHDRGTVEVTTSPTGHRVAVRDAAPDTMRHALAMSGVYRGLLEYTGALDVRAAVLSCRFRGDAATVTSLRFK
ncbi:MAG: protein kinase [Deltaproteobacteria bacterium]|nr:protein kinase [Deltaproteobacteria bacterium]